MSNRLKDQSSPYLLQHAENPVDWYPWCEEAFTAARKEDKPIFLSIGYSTCHWCHVMAHESFENTEIADILNRHFISIKVDREERPDIDSVYMEVCQRITGSGGWPLSIFMTAEQKPFLAGTYFPAESGYGMTGFKELLLIIVNKWEHEKERLLQASETILGFLEPSINENDKEINRKLPEQAAEGFFQSFDKKNGGFGGTPKFPTPHNLLFLLLYAQLSQDKAALRQMGTTLDEAALQQVGTTLDEAVLQQVGTTLDKAVLQQVEFTLDQMYRGGIFDHIGYGFSRYSTDARWLVPHFEKMLYDNALLIIAYAAAYKVSGNEQFLVVAKKTAEYIFREMTSPDGAFYSAQDADCDGEEGKYYLWEYDEVCQVLGREQGRIFCKYFGITEEGNFEGKNIPNLLHGKVYSDVFDAEVKKLYSYRRERGQLHLDDKVLTAWNALMIYAMSMLYRVSGDGKYLIAAQRACDFIDKNLTEGDFLYVSWRDGRRSVKGFLSDYAYYAAAMTAMYEVTADAGYLKRAQELCQKAEEQFADSEGGYFLYGAENSFLIKKPKETYDGALPSGNSVMAYCLVRLAQMSQEMDVEKGAGKDEVFINADVFLQRAERQLAFMSSEAEDYPMGYGMFLLALLMHGNLPEKITVVVSEGDNPEKIISSLSVYSQVKFLLEETQEYKLLNGKTTYYRCKGHRCLPPENEI